MNFINSFLLALFLKPAGFYKQLSVDVTKLKSILTCKLIMDDRQPLSFGKMRQQKTTEPVNNVTWLSLGLYLFMGAVFLIFFFIGNNPALHLTAFFSVYIVMLTLALIVDFTRVLIDVRDNFIVLPKPVNDRTFLVARILHIVIHLSKMAFPLVLPAAIFITFRHGLAGLAAFLLGAILATVFSIFIINATYLGILRFSKPEKFKSIINYLQIGFTILMYGSYQILPRLIDASRLENFDINSLNWINIMPSYWFAALWQILTHPAWNTNLLFGTILAIIMPVAGIYLVIKVFAPAFNQKLTLITGSSDGGQLAASKGNIKPLWGDKFSTLLTSPGPEQLGFDLSWHMMLRSREFKMQVYPGIGYVLVLFVVYTIKSGGFHADSFDISNPDNRFAILSVLYAPALLIMGATAQIPLSPFWKASWIYQMSPIEKPGRIICGSTKAVLAQFMLIPFLLIGIFGIIVNGLAILPAWIMAVSIQIMLAYLLSIINVKSLPFSKPLEKAGSSGNFIKVMLTLVLISGLVFLQWSIFSSSWLMFATAALALIITLLLNKQIANTPWNSISFAK